MEKSKSGLGPADKGDAPCTTFLVRGFADAPPLLQVRVDGTENCLRNLIRHYAGVDIGDIS